MARIFVVIATVGRPDLACRTVDLLADQTRPADGVIVATVSPSDVTGVELARSKPEVIYSEKGLCRQRNRALEFLEGKADIVIYFDDDFIPAPDYIENIENIFSVNPGIVGVTGKLLADGVLSGGYTIEEAQKIIAARLPTSPPEVAERYELYGCNMAIRMSAAQGLRFDEVLPLYGWQEDVDFSNRLGKRGRQISSSNVTGVHLGVNSGRSPGKRLGYSQIANVIYLKRKGTMRAAFGNRLMSRNVCANLLRSFKPEPLIDRRGRLLGNCLALVDSLRGKVDPRKILDM
jgi:Predicted glycosyltransferases